MSTRTIGDPLPVDRAFGTSPARSTTAVSTRLSRIAGEWSAYLTSMVIPPRREQIRVVIFGQGRTGSTLLESLLDSSGNLRGHGELLSTTNREIRFPSRYIRGRARRSRHHFIFHVKIYQLTVDRRRPTDPERFLRSLHADGWKIIYLRRENRVKHALSHVVRETRGAAHKHDDTEESLRVHIDCEALQKDIEERTMFEERERAALEGLQFCEVVYEPDLEHSSTHQQTADRVFDFLSLPRARVTTSHRKVNTRDMRDLIANYDEFVACLRSNDWEHFLD